jgi:DNA-binding transcriptional MerR regulator
VKDGLTVGVVAAAAGVSPDTVRYYERLRLLSKASRSESGYRVFSNSDVERIRAICRAKSLGMSLAEIGTLLPQGRLGRAQCRRVRDLLVEKIASTESHIARLREFTRELRSYLAACDRAIASKREVLCPVFSLAPSADVERGVRTA